jgi:hypothetical protein
MKMPWDIDDSDNNQNAPDGNGPLTPAPRLDGGGATDSSISEPALAALSKSRPDLVQAYRDKMASSNQEVQDARKSQDNGNLANTLGRALNDFGNSQKNDVVLGNRMQDLGKAPSIIQAKRPVYDDSLVNNLTAQGVNRAKDDRSSAEQDFNQETGLQDLQDKRADQDLARGDQANARAKALRENDPNSPDSVQARNYLKTLAPSAATIPNFDQMTATQARAAAPQLMEKYKLDETVAARRDKTASDSADRQVKYQALSDSRDQTTDAKQTAAQSKALNETQAMLETARGNPAVGQAEKDIYSAQKANSLANLYGDPNKLSPQQVNLLAAEVGKIASGGTTSQHELEGITPNTLTGQLAGVTSKLTNEPTPANAAAFVKQYQDYANQLSKDAQGVIQDKYGRVIESRKNKLSDDDYQSLQDNYINRFKTAKPAMSAADQQAAEWAKQNPNDPRAAKILSHLGGN